MAYVYKGIIDSYDAVVDLIVNKLKHNLIQKNEVADLLGLTRSAIYKKIESKSFTTEQIRIICNKFLE